MQAPKIKLGDKEYTARKLKMKAWRSFVKLQKELDGIDQVTAMTDEATMEKVANVLVLAYNNPDLTVDAIMDEMDMADFIPAIQEATQWITMQVSGKLDQFPKNFQTTV